MSALIAILFFVCLSCFLVLFGLAALFFLLRGSVKSQYWRGSGRVDADVIDAEYTVAEPIEGDDDDIITIEALPVPEYDESPKTKP